MESRPSLAEARARTIALPFQLLTVGTFVVYVFSRDPAVLWVALCGLVAMAMAIRYPKLKSPRTVFGMLIVGAWTITLCLGKFWLRAELLLPLIVFTVFCFAVMLSEGRRSSLKR